MVPSYDQTTRKLTAKKVTAISTWAYHTLRSPREARQRWQKTAKSRNSPNHWHWIGTSCQFKRLAPRLLTRFLVRFLSRVFGREQIIDTVYSSTCLKEQTNLHKNHSKSINHLAKIINFVVFLFVVQGELYEQWGYQLELEVTQGLLSN